MTKLEIIALAIQKHEGYYPPSASYPKGSVAWRNKNPGNLVFGALAQAHGAKTYWQHPTTGHKFAIFPTYEDGFKALQHLIENAATGKSQIYQPEMTLLQFFSKYSPIRDKAGNVIPNTPYASAVAKDLGVGTDFKIKNLVETPEAPAAPVKITLPLDKIYLTQGFGEWPAHYAQYGMRGHNGIDFRTKFIDSPLGRRYVESVMAGVVTEVVNQGKAGYGLYVRVKHRGNEETIYAHLTKAYVAVGAKVEAGTRIALTGNSGASTGAHLHFGWRPNGYDWNNGYKGYEDPRKLFGNLLK